MTIFIKTRKGADSAATRLFQLVLLTLALLISQEGKADNYTVNSCSEEGTALSPGEEKKISFWEALTRANSHFGPDTILFNLNADQNPSCCDPASKSCRIPIHWGIWLGDFGTVLNGEQSSGYRIILNGSSLRYAEAGLTIEGPDTTIQNLSFERFRSTAILIDGRWQSATRAILSGNTFSRNGESEKKDCTLVSNNPTMNRVTSTYYGNLLTKTEGEIGIHVLTGVPGTPGIQTVTGDSGCVSGIDFVHNFHLALVTASSSHATILIDSRLAAAPEEALPLLKKVFPLLPTLNLDLFVPDVFVARGPGTEYLHQLKHPDLFACTCYNPTLFIRPPDQFLSGGAVKIQYASNNTVRGNLFEENGFGIRVVGGVAPANENRFTRNIFRKNRKDILIEEANRGIRPPTILMATESVVFGKTTIPSGGGGLVEIDDPDSGLFLSESPVLSDGTFSCPLTLTAGVSLRALVTDPLGNSSAFSDSVTIPYWMEGEPLEEEVEEKEDEANEDSPVEENFPEEVKTADFFDSDEATFNTTNMGELNKKETSDDDYITDSPPPPPPSDPEAAPPDEEAIPAAGGCGKVP